MRVLRQPPIALVVVGALCLVISFLAHYPALALLGVVAVGIGGTFIVGGLADNDQTRRPRRPSPRRSERAVPTEPALDQAAIDREVARFADELDKHLPSH
jgi:hypothetical protein